MPPELAAFELHPLLSDSGRATPVKEKRKSVVDPLSPALRRLDFGQTGVQRGEEDMLSGGGLSGMATPVEAETAPVFSDEEVILSETDDYPVTLRSSSSSPWREDSGVGSAIFPVQLPGADERTMETSVLGRPPKSEADENSRRSWPVKAEPVAWRKDDKEEFASLPPLEPSFGSQWHPVLIDQESSPEQDASGYKVDGGRIPSPPPLLHSAPPPDFDWSEYRARAQALPPMRRDHLSPSVPNGVLRSGGVGVGLPTHVRHYALAHEEDAEEGQRGKGKKGRTSKKVCSSFFFFFFFFFFFVTYCQVLHCKVVVSLAQM